MISGLHVGILKKGFTSATGGRRPLFFHSPESCQWAQVWEGQVFKKGVVKIQTTVVHVERRNFEGDGISVQSVVACWPL